MGPQKGTKVQTRAQVGTPGASSPNDASRRTSHPGARADGRGAKTSTALQTYSARFIWFTGRPTAHCNANARTASATSAWRYPGWVKAPAGPNAIFRPHREIPRTGTTGTRILCTEYRGRSIKSAPIHPVRPKFRTTNASFRRPNRPTGTRTRPRALCPVGVRCFPASCVRTYGRRESRSRPFTGSKTAA